MVGFTCYMKSINIISIIRISSMFYIIIDKHYLYLFKAEFLSFSFQSHMALGSMRKKSLYFNGCGSNSFSENLYILCESKKQSKGHSHFLSHVKVFFPMYPPLVYLLVKIRCLFKTHPKYRYF